MVLRYSRPAAIATGLFALYLAVLPAAPAQEAVSPLPLAEFDKLHAMLKRQKNESRWMEIDWYPSVWEGRQKAAREGKPLFLWAGSGGAPAAGC